MLFSVHGTLANECMLFLRGPRGQVVRAESWLWYLIDRCDHCCSNEAGVLPWAGRGLSCRRDLSIRGDETVSVDVNERDFEKVTLVRLFVSSVSFE